MNNNIYQYAIEDVNDIFIGNSDLLIMKDIVKQLSFIFRNGDLDYINIFETSLKRDSSYIDYCWKLNKEHIKNNIQMPPEIKENFIWQAIIDFLNKWTNNDGHLKYLPDYVWLEFDIKNIDNNDLLIPCLILKIDRKNISFINEIINEVFNIFSFLEHKDTITNILIDNLKYNLVEDFHFGIMLPRENIHFKIYNILNKNSLKLHEDIVNFCKDYKINLSLVEQLCHIIPPTMVDFDIINGKIGQTFGFEFSFQDNESFELKNKINSTMYKFMNELCKEDSVDNIKLISLINWIECKKININNKELNIQKDISHIKINITDSIKDAKIYFKYLSKKEDKNEHITTNSIS